jgi:RNA polymerase sigma-70 factor (ECF subfamily)
MGELKARVSDLPPEVETALSAQLGAARTRWPNGRDPDTAFVDVLVARLPQPRVEELYLAWWCGSGDEAAISAFEAAYADDLRVLASRFREVPADELRQQLRIKLFVGDEPAIRDYAGTGSLKSWLRVTAVRYFIDLTRSARSQRFEQELDEGELLGVSDPQGSQIRAELGAAVKAAFAAAVARLLPRQRVFLRHAYVDRHTLDQIASHYSIHRTTVARTLAAAREQLIAETRANVVAAVGIDNDELSSVIRMLDSRIDLSLSRVLETSRRE